jgi:hypothetical protein
MRIGDQLEGQRQADAWMNINGSVPGVLSMEFVVEGNVFYYVCTLVGFSRVVSMIYIWTDDDAVTVSNRMHMLLCMVSKELRNKGIAVTGYDYYENRR